MFHGGADSLIFWSFRYFLGRQTAATVGFAMELAVAWPLIRKNTQDLIKSELEEAFERDDDARERSLSFRPLGDWCDRAAWEKVREAYSSDKTP